MKKLVFCGLLAILSCSNSFALEKVRLQLQWTHSAQSAGYYMAQEKGFFKEVGLDVEFLEAGMGIDPVKQVVSGKAEYGVGTSSLIISRAKGYPVVVLAAIFQQSPQILIGRVQDKDSDYRHDVEDFKNEKIWLEPNSEELEFLLQKENIPLENIKRANGDALNNFLEGKAMLISGYSTYETYAIYHKKILYKVFSPRSYGFDFYGDNLFTTQSELKNNHKRTEDFLRAVQKGWDYALKNPDETIKIVKENYAKNLEKDFLNFEFSEISHLIKSDLIPIGFMNKDRWEKMIDVYKKKNLIPQDFNIDDFVHVDRSQAEIAELKRYLLVSFVLLVVAMSIILYVRKLNSNLKNVNDKLEEANKKLNNLAGHDGLTGLPNRVIFFEYVQKGIASAKRNSNKIALLFIDLDKFKPINDTYGHHIGDILLKQVSNRLLEAVRETDMVGRIGGDEFVVLLTDLKESSNARAVAEKIIKKIEKPFNICDQEFKISLSIGIAICPDHATTEDDLTKNADYAMYQAKYGGGEKIIFFKSGMSIENTAVKK